MTDILTFSIYIIVFAVAVSGIYTFFSRKRASTQITVANTIQLFYFYSILFVSLLIIINGILLIANFILDEFLPNGMIDSNQLGAATGFSFVIVGIPLWIFHWRQINRQVNETEYSKTSPLQQFYFYLILSVAIASISKNLVFVTESIFTLRDFDPSNAISLMLWASVWIFHWQRINSTTNKTLNVTGSSIFKNVYIYIVAIFGLVLISGGIGNSVYLTLENILDYLSGTEFILDPDSGPYKDSYFSYLSLIPSGLLLWISHWIFFGRKEKLTAVKSTYTYLTTIISAVLVLLGTVLLFWILFSGVLAIFVGGNGQDDSQLEELPAALTLILIGTSIFAYHIQYVRHYLDFGDSHSTSNRIVLYSLALFSIIILSIGLATFIYSCVTYLIPKPEIILSNSSSEYSLIPLTAGISMTFVGGLFWGAIWRETMRNKIMGMKSYCNERKTYLVTFLSLSGITASVTLISFLIIIILALLKGQYDSEAISSLVAPLSILLSLALVAPFHLHLYRKERKNFAEKDTDPLTEPKAVTILSAGNVESFVKQVEELLGYSVQVVKWADEGVDEITQNIENPHGVANAIKKAKGSHLIVIPEPGGIRFYSHDG